MIRSEILLGLPDYEVIVVDECGGRVRIKVRFLGEVSCPGCGGTKLRRKDRRLRTPRHESWGMRRCVLELERYKWVCRACGRSFWQRFPGLQPRLRATEPFRRSVCQKHFDGISRSRLGDREGSRAPRWSAGFVVSGTARGRTHGRLVRRFWASMSTSYPASRLRHNVLRSEEPQGA